MHVLSIAIIVLFLIALLSSSRRMPDLYHHRLQHFQHHPSSYWLWSTSSFRSAFPWHSVLQLVLALLSLYQPLICNSTSNALPFNMLAFDPAQHNFCNSGTHRSSQLSQSLLYIAAKDLRASKPQKETNHIYIYCLYTTLGF